MDSLANYTEGRKIGILKETLKNYGSLLVGLSGGVDSSFLVKAAVDFLGAENVIACTSDGAIYSSEELKNARRFACNLGVKWRRIERDLLNEQNFRTNPPNRCYYCKLDLFERLLAYAKTEGTNVVADGSIKDDLSGHRPGRKAGEELGIKSPLEEAGLTKKEIRKYGNEIGLPVWDKPSNTCLATRIPFGTEITKEKLKQVEESESFLRELGFEGFRVRHHEDIARIELAPEGYQKAFDERDKIRSRLENLGFNYVTLDLEGYHPSTPSEVNDSPL